jgi:hypothetical protein
MARISAPSASKAWATCSITAVNVTGSAPESCGAATNSMLDSPDAAIRRLTAWCLCTRQPGAGHLVNGEAWL